MKQGFFVLSIFALSISAQDANLSFSLSSFKGTGETPIIQLGKSEFYPYDFNEHFLYITLWRNQWTLWTNFEYSSPPRIGPAFAGLRKFRLSFQNDRYSIKLGDLYGQIGRGLGLNMWENQNIDWDSSLRGIWINRDISKRFKFDFIVGKAKGGRHLGAGEGIDPRRRDFSENENILAISGYASKIIHNTDFGAYLILMNGNRSWFTLRESNDFQKVRVSSLKPGVFGKYNSEDFEIFFEFTSRIMSIQDVDSIYSTPSFKWYSYEPKTSGRGAYFSSSYFPGKWGLTIELKDYFFDNANPDERNHLPFKLGRSSLITGPPSTFKEHSSILLSRKTHIMDPDDELGFQIEFNYQANENLFLTLNYSRSSRHSSFEKNTDEFFNSYWNNKKLSTPFIPSSNYGFHPFHEAYLEFNYRYDPFGMNFTAGLSQANEVMLYKGQSFISSERINIQTDEYRLNEFFHQRNLFSIPSRLSFNLPRSLYFSLDMEHQWEGMELVRKTSILNYNKTTSDSLENLDKEVLPYYYRYSSITFGKASRFNVSFLLDYVSNTKTGDNYNTDPNKDNDLERILRRNEINLKNKWFGVEASIYLNPSTILTLFYGSIQGGIKCDNGICVYVPGIDDSSILSLSTNF
tara:strand:+ start:1162 stop:3057 length:1896 start_codon:yes stop_codon:yes gene_type:complete